MIWPVCRNWRPFRIDRRRLHIWSRIKPSCWAFSLLSSRNLLPLPADLPFLRILRIAFSSSLSLSKSKKWRRSLGDNWGRNYKNKINKKQKKKHKGVIDIVKVMFENSTERWGFSPFVLSWVSLVLVLICAVLPTTACLNGGSFFLHYKKNFILFYLSLFF